MFKKSLLVVLPLVMAVFVYNFVTNYQYYQTLPSAYNPGTKLEEVFRTSKTPLLVEFYTDQCGTCQKVTPALHEIYNTRFKERATLVMLDMNNPNNLAFARLFKVNAVPAIYVFNPKVMKKTPIELNQLITYQTLHDAIDHALRDAGTQPS